MDLGEIDMRPPTLTDLPNIWKADGSLRDIYVVGTTLEDWRRFVALAMSYPYWYDGEIAALSDVESVLRDDHSHLLSIGVGNARLNCHFFIDSEIEIDIDPAEIESAADHDAVLNFLEMLGRTLGKSVIVTPENEIQLRSFPLTLRTIRGAGKLIGPLYNRLQEAIDRHCDRPKELKR